MNWNSVETWTLVVIVVLLFSNLYGFFRVAWGLERMELQLGEILAESYLTAQNAAELVDSSREFEGKLEENLGRIEEGVSEELRSIERIEKNFERASEDIKEILGNIERYNQ